MVLYCKALVDLENLGTYRRDEFIARLKSGDPQAQINVHRLLFTPLPFPAGSLMGYTGLCEALTCFSRVRCVLPRSVL